MQPSATIPHRDDKDLEISHVETAGQQTAFDARQLAHAEDDASKILRETGPVDWTIEEERRVLRKIDLWVCSK